MERNIQSGTWGKALGSEQGCEQYSLLPCLVQIAQPIADLQKQDRYNTNTNYFISSYLFLTDRLWLHEIVQTSELTYQDHKTFVLFRNLILIDVMCEV